MRRALRRWCLAALLLALPAASRAAAQQAPAARFPIKVVGDSTMQFAVGSMRWVAPRMTGIVVDPRQRDEVVGRFRVQRVQSGEATALITGLTRPLVADQDVALLQLPRKHWFGRGAFWAGMLLGGIVGAVAATIAS